MILFPFRYKSLLDEIVKTGGPELVDNLKCFVEACEYN